jgi:transposase
MASRRKYTEEFKAEAIRLVKSGERTQAEVCQSLGIRSSVISGWCRSKDTNLTKFSDSEEVKRLKAEVKRLTLEQEILKKATAFFAKRELV